MSKVNGYLYSKVWFEFAFENCDKVTATHGILFFWLVELRNRLGWVNSFQVTSSQNMQAICCKSYNTYKKCFDDLIEWGFVQLIKQSKNQYQCNVIALSNFDKAHDKAPPKAIDKAVMNHLMNHNESIEQSIDDIHKTINNKTIKSKNNKERNLKIVDALPKDENEVYEYMKQYSQSKVIDIDDDDLNDVSFNFFNYYESISWELDDKPIRKWKVLAQNWVKKQGDEYHDCCIETQQMNQFRNSEIIKI